MTPNHPIGRSHLSTLPKASRAPSPFHEPPLSIEPDSTCKICHDRRPAAELFVQQFEQGHYLLCRACSDATDGQDLDQICRLTRAIARASALRRLTHPGFPFAFARLETSPQADALLSARDIASALTRHRHGDWGNLPASVATENDFALTDGRELISSYTADTGVRFYVITASDRSVTTILTADEYGRP